MRYLFLSPPAMGEMQPVLAIAAALLGQDPAASIYVGSGSSFEQGFESFVQALGDDPAAAAQVFRLDLGRTDDVEDYSKHMLGQDADNHRRALLGSHRHARGNPIPFFNYWQAFAAGSEEQRLATIQRILRIIDKIRPDMIIVDQVYGTPFDGNSAIALSFLWFGAFRTENPALAFFRQ